MTVDGTIAGHVVIGVLVTVFGIMHRNDIRRITIEFKNGHTDVREDGKPIPRRTEENNS